MKLCISLIVFFILVTSAAFSQDTITILINNKKAAKCISFPEQTGTNLPIKKATLKLIRSVAVQVKSDHTRATIYKRDLEIAGDDPVIIGELRSRPGYFNLSKTSFKKDLLAGKILQLYLLMNPANEKMMIPSRRVFLANLMMK